MAAGTWWASTIASWPAPLGILSVVAPSSSAACLQRVLERGIERHRLLAVGLPHLEAELFLRGDPLQRLADERLQPRETFGGRRADVDRQLGHTRNDVEPAWLSRDDADVRGHVVAATCHLAQRQHHARPAHERVAAQLHGSRAGVVGLAGEARTEAEHPGDRRDDAEVDAIALQHGPLLDVQLQVGAELADPRRLAQPPEVEAGLGHRVRDAPALPVLQVAVPAECTAAEHPGLEAAALLVVEGDDPERAPRLDAVGLQAAHDVQRSQNAERPVVAAAGGDGVEVRAERDGLPLPRRPAADHVPGGIELGLEAQLGELLHEPGIRLCELGRPGEPRDAPALVAADPRGGLEISCQRRHGAS